MKNKPTKESLKIVSKCYICGKNITNQMLLANKAIYLGKNIYRCCSRKCQQFVLDRATKSLCRRKK